ncbi:TonB family protein [Carboxylicivirga sp. N1Y90]|uniref:energy transducer TonB n=1 Tax=Carboxylicivirga fragile TaxID=3417571 RepID=UPI003D327271|nr:TonB family protein [Marinilabiliaceae bacterium N1Y90]
MKSLAIILSLFIASSNLFSQERLLSENEQIETTVDKLPRLKGARGSFNQFISKKITYPENAKLRGVEGDVWVAFVVTKDGELANVKVDKSVDPILDEVVLRFVRKCKEWKPGVLNREKVNTQMLVPVKFTLSDNERSLAEQLKQFDHMDVPPLFVIDNKPIVGLTQIEDYNVRSIRVIKGDKAVALYGEQAKNGVVVITSKRGTPPIY